MTATTVTGFQGAKAGSGPYLSPRFRANKKSNAGKYYRRKNPDLVIEIDDYLTSQDFNMTPDFDIQDILSPGYAEFGFVKAYKTRLKRRGLDAKQLFCVNRHVITESPRTCLTSLPKLSKRFLVQQTSDKMPTETLSDRSPIDGHLRFDIKNYQAQVAGTASDEPCKGSAAANERIPTSKLETRLRELEDDTAIPGYVVRRKIYGRPLGNITSLDYLSELLKDVPDDNKRRPSVFYRTEIE